MKTTVNTLDDLENFFKSHTDTYKTNFKAVLDQGIQDARDRISASIESSKLAKQSAQAVTFPEFTYEKTVDNTQLKNIAFWRSEVATQQASFNGSTYFTSSMEACSSIDSMLTNLKADCESSIAQVEESKASTMLESITTSVVNFAYGLVNAAASAVTLPESADVTTNAISCYNTKANHTFGAFDEEAMVQQCKEYVCGGLYDNTTSQYVECIGAIDMSVVSDGL